ncbi:uncharacterized protein BKCO1_5600032 [Diplodia corticola]|uniref:Uncharacterized protein n=1 Tax=Diplodia corticola TaxID=236234 RepID=A0A1J9RTB7_9PEZI|nr:uncharacterized protein BKCO1_5600032 [Diplodia corticola]OJD30773.1 hypothetical protein BKCO1_5600032 [Diplodia corticola]
MSATANDDAVKAVSNQEGEFSSKVPPSEPLEKGGHKPGVLATPADHAGEFHIQTLPAGTAPASSTHAPQNDPEIAPGSTTALDSLPGATSGDVHTGLGHPGSGQTSQELHHDGNRGGLAGVGATDKQSTVDAHDPGFSSQRALGKDVETGTRGTVGGAPAEERLPASAEEVASEAPKDRSTSGVASEHAGRR